MSAYDDAKAKCPFYQRGGSNKIVCEGIIKNSVTVQEFNTKNDRNTHKSRYCDGQYSKCELYKMLQRKYD